MLVADSWCGGEGDEGMSEHADVSEAQACRGLSLSSDTNPNRAQWLNRRDTEETHFSCTCIAEDARAFTLTLIHTWLTFIQACNDPKRNTYSHLLQHVQLFPGQLA